MVRLASARVDPAYGVALPGCGRPCGGTARRRERTADPAAAGFAYTSAMARSDRLRPPHRWVLRLVALALALLPGTCAVAEGPSRAQAPIATGGTRLELWTIALAPAFSGYVEASLALFEAAHPGTRVVWRDLPLGSLGDELARRIADGTPPDVVNVNVPLALGFTERGWLLDLAPSLDAADRAAYFPDLEASFRLAGGQRALPWYLTMPVLLFDPEAFAAAGLDPARPPATAAEFRAAAQKLHARLGGPGAWPNLGAQQLLYRFLEAGLPVVTDGGTRAAFDTPQHAAFLGDLVGLYADGVIPEAAFAPDAAGPAASPTAAFLQGIVPMLTANPQLLPRLRAENPALYARVGVAPYPAGPGGVVHAPLMGLAVTAASQRPGPALALARFLTGTERELAFARLTAILPASRRAAADPYFGAAGAGAAPEERARAVAAAQLPRARDLTMELPNASELFARFQRDVEEAFRRYLSAPDALHDAARWWDAKL